jgi:hypothetical protein
MDPRNYIAVASAVIALGAAAASAVINLRGQRRQYFAELRKWADEACGTLSAAVHACDLNPAHKDGNFFSKRHELRIALSSLADRGRWFFPNLHHTEVGVDKDEAFRGLRQPALGLLVKAYRLVGSMSYTDQQSNLTLREPLVEVKRQFVSEVQNYLDPRNRRTIFTQLTEFTGYAPEDARL